LFFTGEGCHLLGLATAEEAIEAIKQIKYDIVISDYKLPGMNGLEFFRQAEKTIPNAMKILITGYGSDQIESAARRCGIDDFIQKPLTTQALEKSLTNLIETHQAR
jgi:YesN/AraC family two-component response regulator